MLVKNIQVISQLYSLFLIEIGFTSFFFIIPEADRLVGFNEEGMYDAADYRTVFTLVTNSKQRGVGK